MRAALAVVVFESILLIGLTFVQFETGVAIGRNNPEPTLDPLTDPLISFLSRIAIVVWLAASFLIGVLVARGKGRVLQAAGLAFGAVTAAVIASALLEQLATSGLTLVDAGRGPRGVYFFVPPDGWTPDSSYLTLLIPIAVVLGGGLAAIEAAVAAALTRRLRGTT
jgi:hypothetical protein